MSLHFTDKLVSLKQRLVNKLRSKSRKRRYEPSEKENYNVPDNKCAGPRRKHINVEHRGRVWDGEDAEDIRHRISRHPESTAIPPSPERVGPGFAVEQEQLKNEAQQQDLSSPPSPPHRRSTRSKTWESVKSVSVSSIRSVATVAQAIVCMPRLTRSESHIPSQSLRGPAVPRAEPGSQPEGIPEEENGQLSLEASHSYFAKSKHPTFPLDKSTMSDFTELAAIRAKLKERERTSDYFNQIWEDEALPRMKETMDEGNITDYNISIQADYGEYGVLRIVEVVTRKRLPEFTNQELIKNVSKIFTPERSLHVTISFTIGVVKRTSGPEEPYISPGNTRYHSPLMIGDSVGFEKGEYAATIGPAIKWDDRIGCLVNFHLFHGAPGIREEEEAPECHLVHPAGIDCPKGTVSVRIAKLGAHSGYKMYRTQRVSRSFREFAPKLPPEARRVETDWAFCDLEGEGLLLQNCIRYAPDGREVEPHSGPVSETMAISPKLRLVRCTGRSSGFRYAVVCEAPILVQQGAGEPTREWYLENVPGLLAVERWNAGGIGIPGDSGAAIIDDETRAFIGHVWGRNCYEEDAPIEPRLAYFSHAMDIFDDFESRYPAMGRPRLRTKTDTATSAHTQPVVGGRDTSTQVKFANGEAPRRSKAGLPVSVVKLLGRPVSQNSLAHSTSGSSGTTFTEQGITLEIEATGKDMGDFQSLKDSTRNISLRSSDDGLRT